MKKKLSLLASLFAILNAAQTGAVGINTETPKVTLQIVGKPATTTQPDGLMAPQVTGDQLFAKSTAYNATDHTGAIVYVTVAASAANQTGKTALVTSPGYYFFNGTEWQRFVITKEIGGVFETTVASGSYVTTTYTDHTGDFATPNFTNGTPTDLVNLYNINTSTTKEDYTFDSYYYTTEIVLHVKFITPQPDTDYTVSLSIQDNLSYSRNLQSPSNCNSYGTYIDNNERKYSVINKTVNGFDILTFYPGSSYSYGDQYKGGKCDRTRITFKASRSTTL